MKEQLRIGRPGARALAAALLLALATTSPAGAAGGTSTVTVPGTAASIDNPFAVNGTPSVGSGLSFSGVAAVTVLGPAARADPLVASASRSAAASARAPICVFIV